MCPAPSRVSVSRHEGDRRSRAFWSIRPWNGHAGRTRSCRQRQTRSRSAESTAASRYGGFGHPWADSVSRQCTCSAIATQRLASESNPALRFWTIVDPSVPESFEQSDELLRHERCAGIKIHPHAHAYEIREHGPALLGFAAERNAVVLAHSGDIGSYPEDFVPFADRYPDIQLILAHLGNSDDGSISRQVEAIERARNGNLWVDTSSARSMFERVDRMGGRTHRIRSNSLWQRHALVLGWGAERAHRNRGDR